MRPDLNRTYTAQEYLELVDKFDCRYEFHDGRLIEREGRPGSSVMHALIAANAMAILARSIEGGGRTAYNGDLLIALTGDDSTFSDGFVVDGRAILTRRDNSDAVTNPMLTVEVLSDTSELRDRTTKFADYREIETFREYVLISQTKPLIETFYKQDAGTWVLADFEGLDAKVQLRSLGVSIALADIYANVTFPTVTAKPYDPRVSN